MDDGVKSASCLKAMGQLTGGPTQLISARTPVRPAGSARSRRAMGVQQQIGCSVHRHVRVASLQRRAREQENKKANATTVLQAGANVFFALVQS